MPDFSRNFFSLLSDLAELMANPPDIAQALNDALKLLAKHLGMMRGAITIISPQTGTIHIEASYGLNETQRKRGSYLPGEGITGQVIAQGKPMCIADISKEPMFLNKTQSRDLNRETISFLCVPICLGGTVTGALSVDQLGNSRIDLQKELELLKIIASLLAHAAYEAQERFTAKRSLTERPAGFIGNADCMLQVYEQISIVAPTSTTVLLQGESGTGKELAARAIHAKSSSSNGPFISLNCAALPENLIESELFGHERGAFTGAAQMRKGRFELANNGTLFLDEIGELSLQVQAKLLRVLQEKQFERLGGAKQINCNARLITATNRNLAEMVDSGGFRRDLFYRLNVFPIILPPLRQRPEDILPLATFFLNQFARINNKKPPKLSNKALKLLEAYSWPGNIRELQNTMERAILLLGNYNIVLPDHLACSFCEDNSGALQNDNSGLSEQLSTTEKACITDALIESNGRLCHAARKLGITQRILGLRMKKYNLNYKDFRNL